MKLAFSVSQLEFPTGVPTKRSVFSLISKLFDPLGLLAPVTIRAKILMQKLWELKLQWDDPLPEDKVTVWRTC